MENCVQRFEQYMGQQWSCTSQGVVCMCLQDSLPSLPQQSDNFCCSRESTPPTLPML
jgi:hypothetical protein